MPWIKNVTRTVNESDTNLRVEFEKSSGSWRVKIAQYADAPDGAVTVQNWEDAVANTSLTTQQKSDLLTMLGVLLSDARTALGYTNS